MELFGKVTLGRFVRRNSWREDSASRNGSSSLISLLRVPVASFPTEE